jgi:hypothetical protein
MTATASKTRNVIVFGRYSDGLYDQDRLLVQRNGECVLLENVEMLEDHEFEDQGPADAFAVTDRGVFSGLPYGMDVAICEGTSGPGMWDQYVDWDAARQAIDDGIGTKAAKARAKKLARKYFPA